MNFYVRFREKGGESNFKFTGSYEVRMDAHFLRSISITSKYDIIFFDSERNHERMSVGERKMKKGSEKINEWANGNPHG